MWNLYNQPPCMSISIGDVLHSSFYRRNLEVVDTESYAYTWCTNDNTPVYTLRFVNGSRRISRDNPSLFTFCNRCTHHKEK